MNTTTITVNGAVGDEVWYLDEVHTQTYDRNGDLDWDIITDYEIKSGKIWKIEPHLYDYGSLFINYKLDSCTGEDLKSKIYFTKSGARRARLRLLKQAKEKYSTMIWGANV